MNRKDFFDFITALAIPTIMFGSFGFLWSAITADEYLAITSLLSIAAGATFGALGLKNGNPIEVKS